MYVLRLAGIVFPEMIYIESVVGDFGQPMESGVIVRPKLKVHGAYYLFGTLDESVKHIVKGRH